MCWNSGFTYLQNLQDAHCMNRGVQTGLIPIRIGICVWFSSGRVMSGTGGCENFFHCHTCCCYSTQLKNSHPCVEGAIHHDCPICFEYLFESVNDVTVLLCGHTIHKSCLKEMREHFQYACPLCLKSVCDMSKVWEKFDLEIAATPIPEPYQNKMVSILCFSFLYDDVGYCRSSSC
ncbi:hypothetical protein AAZX31_04G071200 [Glycine max]